MEWISNAHRIQIKTWSLTPELQRKVSLRSQFLFQPLMTGLLILCLTGVPSTGTRISERGAVFGGINVLLVNQFIYIVGIYIITGSICKKSDWLFPVSVSSFQPSELQPFVTDWRKLCHIDLYKAWHSWGRSKFLVSHKSQLSALYRTLCELHLLNKLYQNVINEHNSSAECI